MEEKETIITEQNVEEKPNRKKSGFGIGVLTGVLLMVAVIAVFCVVGMQTGYMRVNNAETEELVSEETMKKLKTIKGLIALNYYEEVTDEEIAEGLYKGMVAAINDPYSAYYTADELEDVTTTTTREYYGIGATLSQDRETKIVTVTYIYEDTPAEKAGLKVGDAIVAVEDTESTTVELDELVEMIHGDEGTIVHMMIYREGESEYREIDIERGAVNLPSLDYEMLDGEIGYIYIMKFAKDTPNEFREAVADLKSQGMKAMIIDVRYNGGGLLDCVVEILDEILPEGTVVYTEDKYGNRVDETSSGETKMEYPIAVLVNETSASASEILAGAIRDYDYGTIIGTTTYGKGCVQKTYKLTDGSAVKLTVEKYFTPNGENIQDTGITPDIELEYEFLGGEEDEYETRFDNQILKAIEILEQEL